MQRKRGSGIISFGSSGGITTFTTLAICMCARFLQSGRMVVWVHLPDHGTQETAGFIRHLHNCMSIMQPKEIVSSTINGLCGYITRPANFLDMRFGKARRGKCVGSELPLGLKFA